MSKQGVILGVGAPNQCRDGKKTKCAIILCDDIGFIRVYPIPAEKPFPVWGKVICDMERNHLDSRFESYKISPEFEIIGNIEDRDEKRHLLNSCCLKSGNIDPIDYQNENRASILLVRQEYGNASGSLAQQIPDLSCCDPEFDWVTTKAAHWNKPYITWRSVQGKIHNSHLVGAEIYEGLRKNPTLPWNIFNNIRLNDPDYDHWMLMGNMRDRRNIWVIVHFHRLKKTIGSSMRLYSDLLNGRPEEWPYSKQEDSNVRVAGNQLGLFTTEDISLANYPGNMGTMN